MGLRDTVAAQEDVAEELVGVPQWGDTVVLFRGISYAALDAMRDVDMEAAQNGDMEQAIKMIQATACDPETGELAFLGEEGAAILRRRSYDSIIHLLTKGALIVLGIDKGETAGKGSSSAETDSLTPVG